MRDKFLQTIQDHNLLEKGDGIVLGVSGGPDSMCMLHLFCSIREAWSLSLYAVHLNHGFRGEAADADADYVADMCKAWEVPLFSYYTKVESLAKEMNTSFEDAGRKERYRLFFEALDANQAQKIAVAQNKNDQAETVLMRLIRGAGIEGLSGIQYGREDGVIRPLLDCSRSEIEAYCESHQIQPRIDHTNTDVQYTRNKIRWEILKGMSEINPSVMDNLVKTSQLLRDDNAVLNELTEATYRQIVDGQPEAHYISLTAFNQLSIGLKRRLIRKCIEVLRGHLIDVTYDEVETIINLAMRQRTNSKKNYHGLYFEISYDRLLIYLGKIKAEGGLFELKVREMTREEFDDYTLSNDEVAVDQEKIAGRLSLKYRQSGDAFQPVGMSGSKKIKDFFIDEKVPREQRANIPIIWDDTGIVWIVGYRQDRRYLVEERTSKVLILQCMKLLTP
ncbi:MAG: tRNA lysidine(34) synthetase TilS [Clostridia bacterium]|nr:tRNA lysidine(34) synthetase TilS [Clostridia bacterium]